MTWRRRVEEVEGESKRELKGGEIKDGGNAKWNELIWISDVGKGMKEKRKWAGRKDSARAGV